MQIYLIRHTSPLIAKGICYGQSDIALVEESFEEEYAAICSKIPEDIELFYTSPLRRCAILAKRLSTKVILDERLMELNFGDWELQSWNDLNQQDVMQWMANFVGNKVPNGENYLDLYERTSAFMEALPQEACSKIGIITHAGNIRSFISWILDLPLENSFRINLNYGAVVELDINKDKNLNKLVSIL